MEIANIYSSGGLKRMTLQELFENTHTPEIDRLCRLIKEYFKDMTEEKISRATLNLTQMMHCYVRSKEYQSNKSRLQRQYGHFCAETALETINFYASINIANEQNKIRRELLENLLEFSRTEYLAVFALEKIMSSLLIKTDQSEQSKHLFENSLNDANAVVSMLMGDDIIIEKIRNAEERKNQLERDSKLGRKHSKQYADEEAESYVEDALAFVKIGMNQNKFTPNSLADRVISSAGGPTIAARTLRGRISKDPRFISFLKPHASRGRTKLISIK